MTWMQDLDKTAVWRAGTEGRKTPYWWQVEDLEISGEEDLIHGLHSGQTVGVQEVEGQEATSPQDP